MSNNSDYLVEKIGKKDAYKMIGAEVKNFLVAVNCSP
jgi:hypothetical protein